MSADNPSADDREDVGQAPGTRQRLTRIGSRRARLEPVPGTDPHPEEPRRRDSPANDPRRRSAADEQYLRDLPPHWS
ncbi:MAG: hypothetical protein ACTJHU_00915 [Mycetocola sp.]